MKHRDRTLQKCYGRETLVHSRRTWYNRTGTCASRLYIERIRAPREQGGGHFKGENE